MAEQLYFEFDVPVVTSKVCKVCGEEKSLSDYAEYKPGYTSGRCRACMNVYLCVWKRAKRAHGRQEKQRFLLEHPEMVKKHWTKNRKCTVVGCIKKHKAHGYCKMHWVRWKKCGDPLYIPPNLQKCREAKSLGLRWCAQCQQMKGVSDFPAELRRLIGLKTYCKACAISMRYRYVQAHPDAVRRTVAKWQKANKEKYLEYRRNLYHRRLEHFHSWQRAYAVKNPERILRNRLARKSRIKGNGGTFRPHDIVRLWNKFRGYCAYCGVNKATSIDHVIPTVRGGTSFIGNLLPSCKSCNSSKGKRTIMEWRMAKRTRFNGVFLKGE